MSASGKTKRKLVEDAVREHLTDEGLVVRRAPPSADPAEVLTAAEAAALLRIDDEALLAAAAGGELPGREIAGEWRFSRAALMAWLGGEDRDARSDTVVDTGLEYAPGDRVRVRVVRRAHRLSVTDDGRAIEKAGRPPGWREGAERVGKELDVNVGRHGVIELPVVRAGPGEGAIVRRIGAASLALYQELLELQD